MKNVYWSSCKPPFILVRFLMKLEVSRQVFEKSSNIKFHENPSVGAELFHVDRWTDGQT